MSGHWVLLQNVVSILTALVLLAGLLGVADRFVGGRLRNASRRWLGIQDLHERLVAFDRDAARRDRKLNHLHEEHGLAMVADHDLATAVNELSETVCGAHDIPEGERPPELDTDRMADRAAEAKGAWPGEFIRDGDGPAD